jgi:alkanesulfonate monooxygenase SsuD/methylene tetrahydromethanopterin reductase-like flavin-dependent oxidoreductase (luciferase family)
VTNPVSRIAPLTACAIASVNALAPGRTILGIGTGNTARRTLGMPAARLDVLRDHVRVCRDLLSGKTTPYHEGERHRMVKFLNLKSGAINIQQKVPIYVAASGPKTLELAGEIADGVILFGAVSPSLIHFCLDHVRTGADRAGRNPKRIYTLCMTAFHLTKPGEKLETSRVRKAVGPFVTSASNIFAFSCPNPEALPAELRDDLVAFLNAYRVPDEPIETRHLQLYSDYLQGFKKEHEPLVTEKMIRATTLTGSREEVSESIHAMQKAGMQQVAIQAVTEPQETIETFSKEIIRRWK